MAHCASRIARRCGASVSDLACTRRFACVRACVRSVWTRCRGLKIARDVNEAFAPEVLLLLLLLADYTAETPAIRFCPHEFRNNSSAVDVDIRVRSEFHRSSR